MCRRVRLGSFEAAAKGMENDGACLRASMATKRRHIPVPNQRTSWRFLEFFTVNIRNKNTRAAYARAAGAFLRWCVGQGIGELGQVQPVHVAAYIEALQAERSAPTVKQHLAAIRMLFDWLVTGQVMPSNPAHAVRGPRYSVSKGSDALLVVDDFAPTGGSGDGPLESLAEPAIPRGGIAQGRHRLGGDGRLRAPQAPRALVDGRLMGRSSHWPRQQLRDIPAPSCRWPDADGVLSHPIPPATRRSPPPGSASSRFGFRRGIRHLHASHDGPVAQPHHR